MVKVKDFLPKKQPRVDPMGFTMGREKLVIPNHSGDIVTGFVKKVPSNDFDIANKKYVDDSISPENTWDVSGSNLVPANPSLTVEVPKELAIGQTTATEILDVDGNTRSKNVLPRAGGTYAVGGSTNVWATMYARTYSGDTDINITPVGNTSITQGNLYISGATAQVVLPLQNDAATPTLAFGDGDTGLFEAFDDDLRVGVGGDQRFRFTTTAFEGRATAPTPSIVNETVSSTNPGYTFVNDEDTGIGAAAADQLSLIAGGSEGIRVSGSTAIEMDATQKVVIPNADVGIGTTSPERKLHIVDSGGDPIILAEDSTQNSIILIKATAANKNSILQFGDVGSDEIGWVNYDHNTDDMTFRVNSATRMLIDSSGNVGIGTVSPGDNLVVQDSQSGEWVAISLINSDWGTGETTQKINQYFKLSQGGTSNLVAGKIQVGKDDDWDDAASSDSYMAFSTRQSNTVTEHMRIDNDGNVGIGDTAPTEKLIVAGNISGARLLLENSPNPTTPNNGGVLFCSGGALLYLGSSGTQTTLASA